MLNLIRHRGPDGRGIYLDDQILLGHVRLSIIDLRTGHQPIPNEDRSIWLVCNGEIFNYVELREELKDLGHSFRTRTDVEVLLHLYEEYGFDLLKKLNGQYAFAIWDSKRKRLFLARDHVGICPLFFVLRQDSFFFASEIKAFFPIPEVHLTLEPRVLKQVFTFWAPLPGYSPFKDVAEIKPGHYAVWERNRFNQFSYWTLKFPEQYQERNSKEVYEKIYHLLLDAVRIRLRADVPVGAYLSGGIDSSAITWLIKRLHPGKLKTFSIGFEDVQFDEQQYQKAVSAFLQTEHHFFCCKNQTIGEYLKDVIWHAEKPILRTAPVPMYVLSEHVRNQNYKVVLTGEGADEYFSGYGIFKETKIRCFHARQPQSKWRPLLYQKLYPYLSERGPVKFWEDYFQRNLLDTDNPFYSHLLRWRNTQFLCRFFSEDLKATLSDYDPIEELRLDLNGNLEGMGPYERAHFLESYLFLSNYLINSQGERMLMAHGVEGRYPFLDIRVVEFACALPPHFKLRALKEKWILRKAFEEHLPSTVVWREKKPFRAPIRSFLLAAKRFLWDCLEEVVFEKSTCLFNKNKVHLLAERLFDESRFISEREEMAFIGILTTALLDDQFANPPQGKMEVKREDTLVFDFRQNNRPKAEK